MTMEMLLGHLVGDYLWQNDWMALNKKKQVLPCLVHCLLYTSAVCVLTGFVLPVWAVLLVFAAHFVQDHTGIIGWYMRIMGQQKFASGPCAPWSSIVVDNTFHLLLLHGIGLATRT